MRGLYAIVDIATLERRGLDPLRFARAVLQARPAALQLRDKRRDARRTLRLLRDLRAPTRQAGALLIANDRADLATLADCDGVHVGRQDLPADAARQVMRDGGCGRAVVGASVHNANELEEALQEHPDYLAFGPVFGTTSKADPDPRLGPEGLDALVAAARARAPSLPCVAIGGITLDRAAMVAPACPCAAVIADLLPTTEDATDRYDEIARRAAALHRALGG